MTFDTGSFDFIIVGGGTAGLVLASRIAETPALGRVLVIEAGDDQTQDPRVNVPAFWPTLLSTGSDWSFKTVSQAGLSGRQNVAPQGRLLGGSSALNGLSFVPPSKATINAWRDLGNAGWDWDSFSKSLARSFTLSGNAKSHNHDASGPLQLTVPDITAAWQWPITWEDTLKGLEIPVTNNPYAQDGKVTGAFMVADAIDKITKSRSYAAKDYYLRLAKGRENLTVRTGIVVDRILFDGSRDTEGRLRAIGVRYTTEDGRSHTIQANKEVIVTAGAINSPRLLELSGIGDKGRIESLGISSLVHNPNVGENLQNHPICTLAFKLRKDLDEGHQTIDQVARQDPEAVSAAMKDYTENQSGSFSRSGTNSIALLPLPGTAGGHEEGQRKVRELLARTISCGSAPTKPTSSLAQKQESFIRDILESAKPSGHYLTFSGFAHFSPDGTMPPPPPGNDSFYTIGISLAHPMSRGSVHISSSSPSTAPTIDPNYFSHALDVEVMARHLQFITSTLRKAEPLASHISDELGNSTINVEELEDLGGAKQFLIENAVGAYHFAGTCSMMSKDLGGVVNSELFVYGVSNLRVCDASIIPVLPSANPQATVYGLAEHGAHIIKTAYLTAGHGAEDD